MLRILVKHDGHAELLTEAGEDFLKILEAQGVYVKNLSVLMDAGGTAVRASLVFERAEIAVPEELICWRRVDAPPIVEPEMLEEETRG
ncbi:MAG: hypothetical protein AB7T38_02455 [Nitrospirales bacterium]